MSGPTKEEARSWLKVFVASAQSHPFTEDCIRVILASESAATTRAAELEAALAEAVRLMEPFYAMRKWLEWLTASDFQVAVDAGASSVDPESEPLVITLGDLRALASFVARHKLPTTEGGGE